MNLICRLTRNAEVHHSEAQHKNSSSSKLDDESIYGENQENDNLIRFTKIRVKSNQVDVKKRQRQVMFRPLNESDKETIRILHEEWFPVRYQDDFYDSLTKNAMLVGGGRLFSAVALLMQDEECDFLEAENGISQSNLTRSLEYEMPGLRENFCSIVDPERATCDRMIGCVVGSFVKSSKAPTELRSRFICNPLKHSEIFYIMTLGATAEFRNMGLGTALVKRCLKVAEENLSCGAIYLHVITYNKAAIRLYEKLDFVKITEIKDYYNIDGKNYNCYLYARHIHGTYMSLNSSILSHLSNFLLSVWNALTSQCYSALRIETSSNC